MSVLTLPAPAAQGVDADDDVADSLAPAELVRDFPEHYGIHLAFVGEDGQAMVALGHHDDRRFVAAFNRHVRRDLGWRGLTWETGIGSYEVFAGGIKRTWAVLARDCGDHGDGADPGCAYCDEIRHAWADGSWWMRWDVEESEPGRFPVTRWEA